MRQFSTTARTGVRVPRMIGSLDRIELSRTMYACSVVVKPVAINSIIRKILQTVGTADFPRIARTLTRPDKLNRLARCNLLVRESLLAPGSVVPARRDSHVWFFRRSSSQDEDSCVGGVREGIHAPAEFVYIGASGVKQFIDTSLPPGPTRVTYQITAIRSTRASHPAQFTINFGVAGEEKRGGLTITDEAA